MALERGQPGTIWASGNYVSATGALAAGSTPYNMLAGVHNGPGDNTVAMFEGIDITQCTIHVQTLTGGFSAATVTPIDDTHVQVLTWDAGGLALAADFFITITRTA